MKATLHRIKNPKILVNGIEQNDIQYEIVLLPETEAEEFIFDELEAKKLELTDKYIHNLSEKARFVLEFKENPHE